MTETREAHDWFKRYGLTCCRKCGFVKNSNSDAKGCVGVVKVELRAPSPTE